MKKIIVAFLTWMLFFPVIVQADDGIRNYRMDITILDNGDVTILEAFDMDGLYNGSERIINYKGAFNSYYGNRLSSTGDASIYNGTGLTLHEIRGIDFDSEKTLLELQENGDLFDKVNKASKGDYGAYTVDKQEDGEKYLIYNHSRMNKDFFLSYTLHNMAVLHNDVAELDLNIFMQNQVSIGNLEIYFHIPTNQQLLRVWGHGVSDGNSEIIDFQTVKVDVTDMGLEDAIDVRLVFDKEAIINSSKTTDIDAFERIIANEEKLAELANEERDQKYRVLQEEAYGLVEQAERSKNRNDYEEAYRKINLLRETDELKTELLVRLVNLESKVERKETILRVLFSSTSVAWILGLFIITYYIYRKFDKEYEPQFKGKYFRDFPASYGPATVGYLLHRKVSNDDLSASILDLINRKVISFEEKDRDYIFKLLKHKEKLTESEERLLKFLFGDEKEITLSEFKKGAKKNYEDFITSYSNWLNRATMDAEKECFYEDLTVCKVIGILYSLIGIVAGICLAGKPTYFSTLWMSLLGFLTLIYFIAFTKKTVKGAEDYAKWTALKRFMEDFGKMDEKELPEVTLWEKYLVYAISLGCADKLAKQMRVKIENFETSNVDMTDMVFDMMYFNHLINFNRVINQSVQQSITSAYNERIATSNHSSGQGFGGGFSGGSFGGGFGGGGGSVGRF